jgi:hypothetical protein
MVSVTDGRQYVVVLLLWNPSVGLNVMSKHWQTHQCMMLVILIFAMGSTLIWLYQKKKRYLNVARYGPGVVVLAQISGYMWSGTHTCDSNRLHT